MILHYEGGESAVGGGLNEVRCTTGAPRPSLADVRGIGAIIVKRRFGLLVNLSNNSRSMYICIYSVQMKQGGYSQVWRRKRECGISSRWKYVCGRVSQRAGLCGRKGSRRTENLPRESQKTISQTKKRLTAGVDIYLGCVWYCSVCVPFLLGWCTRANTYLILEHEEVPPRASVVQQVLYKSLDV